MKFINKFITFFIIILLLFINQNEAYKNREIVRVNLQTKIGTVGNIEHRDLSSKLAPRFKVDLSKSLLEVDPKSANGKKVDILPDILYRILFSFDNERFKTTWITVSDGNGKFLNHIDFIFIYSNDKIIDLKWNLDYNDEEIHHKKKPSNFYINYRWEEIKDKDLSSGLFVLFSVGFIVSIISFGYISFSFANKSNSKTKKLPSYYQKVKNENNNINSYDIQQQQQQQHHHQQSYQQRYSPPQQYYQQTNDNNNNYTYNYSNNLSTNQQPQPHQQQQNKENIQPLTSYDTSPSYHLSPPQAPNDDELDNKENNNNNNEEINNDNNLDVSDSEIESFVELNRKD